jgi:hypothetical protein
LITAGTYTLAGAGGGDIGAFSATINVTQAVTITGGLPATVNRNQDLKLAWTGGGSGLVLIAGTSAALISGSPANGTFNTGTFICATTADKQAFTVPSSVLLQLPATPAGAGVGALAVYTTSTPAANNGLFSAPLTGGGTTDFSIFTAGIGNSSTPVYQ